MRLFRRPLPAAGATRPDGFHLERMAAPEPRPYSGHSDRIERGDATTPPTARIETRPVPEILRLRQALANITADRDQLEAANGLLVARVHTLADEVRAMSMPPVGWHYRGGDLVTPWPGERNPT